MIPRTPKYTRTYPLFPYPTRFRSRGAPRAWNTQGHVEAWYGVMGMGAVCHTLNPRLTAAQLGSMLAQSEARVLLVSPDLLPLAREASANLPALRHILLLDLGTGQGGAEALEPLILAAARDRPWGDFDENTPSGLCFTIGRAHV